MTIDLKRNCWLKLGIVGPTSMVASLLAGGAPAMAEVRGAGLTVDEAAVQGGELVIIGRGQSAGMTIRLDGTDRLAKVGASREFVLRTRLLPESCEATLRTSQGSLRVAIGNCGPKGDPGPKGARGPQGVAGPAGDKGPEGPGGSRGPDGPRGADGARGPAGADGETGAVGATGPVGATGAVGATGPAGASGQTGPQGFTGATGASGALAGAVTRTATCAVPAEWQPGTGTGLSFCFAACLTTERGLLAHYQAVAAGSVVKGGTLPVVMAGAAGALQPVAYATVPQSDAAATTATVTIVCSPT